MKNPVSKLTSYIETESYMPPVLQLEIYDRFHGKLFVILTDECLKDSEKVCDPATDLCTDAALDYSYIRFTDGSSKWQTLGSPTHIFKPKVSQLLKHIFEPNTKKDPKSYGLRELLLSGKRTEEQNLYLETFLPLVRILIYLPPCSCLLITAIQICEELRSRYVHTAIRPDYRLPSTCCSGRKGLQRVREIADRIRGAHDYEPEGYDKDFLDQLESLDLAWMESQMIRHDEEQVKKSVSFSPTVEAFRLGWGETYYDFIILLGEAGILGPEMMKSPFTRRARIPKESEIYSLAKNYWGSEEERHKWDFSGRFTSQSSYQWSKLDPALSNFQEPSPPPPSTSDWSNKTQERKTPSATPSYASEHGQEELGRDKTFPKQIGSEAESVLIPTETMLPA
jgi:hypothetical protein